MTIDLVASLEAGHAAVSLPVWLDLAAIAVGSVCGVLEAQRRKLDLVGYVGLSLVCALGGGLIRDVIMQAGTVYMLDEPYAIAMCLVVAVVGFFFTGALLHVPELIEWADILAVGLFAAAGTDKALVYGLNPLACVLMGVLTGVGGGMLRDVMLGDVPRIFRRENLYATCALGGALAYFLLAREVGLVRQLAVMVCVVVTAVLRRVSLRYNVLLPSEADLTPRVARHMRSLYHAAQEEGRRNAARALRRHGRREGDERDLQEPR